MRSALILAVVLPLVFGAGDTPAGMPACTEAQHARYQAVGPDGRQYATWHPLIDHTLGCVHSHEHGSDPALVMPGYRPLFDYGAQAQGRTELHPGFKGYAFDLNGSSWYIVHHQGSADAHAGACVEHHAVDIAIWQGGVKVADLHLMPSFGNAQINRTGAPVTSCPQTSTTGGVRQFPSMDADNVGYEPWRVGRANLPFLQWGDLTFNVKNPQSACLDSSCAETLRRSDAYGPAAGTFRTLTFEGNNSFWLRATPEYSGTFVWDGAQQYLAPGLDIRVGAQALAPVTSAMLYVCIPGAPIDEAQYRRLPVSGSN